MEREGSKPSEAKSSRASCRRWQNRPQQAGHMTELAQRYHRAVHAASRSAVDGEEEAQLTTPVSNLFCELVAEACRRLRPRNGSRRQRSRIDSQLITINWSCPPLREGGRWTHIRAMSQQPDLFPAEPRRETVDPAEVRDEMIGLLATARAALDAAPWDARRQRFWRTVYSQMSRWLTDPDEAEQLCFEFLLAA
jgi:hypothetical protein